MNDNTATAPPTVRALWADIVDHGPARVVGADMIILNTAARALGVPAVPDDVMAHQRPTTTRAYFTLLADQPRPATVTVTRSDTGTLTMGAHVHAYRQGTNPFESRRPYIELALGHHYGGTTPRRPVLHVLGAHADPDRPGHRMMLSVEGGASTTADTPGVIIVRALFALTERHTPAWRPDGALTPFTTAAAVLAQRRPVLAMADAIGAPALASWCGRLLDAITAP